MKIDIFRPNFTSWLKESMDNRIELLLLDYYTTEKHELRLYASTDIRKDPPYGTIYVLWDNDDSYYYSSRLIAKQSFERMCKLYYYHENNEGNIEEAINSASEVGEFIKNFIENEVNKNVK